jgi:L-asparaginase
MTRVGILTLGGTISMSAGTAAGVVPELGGAELTAQVPGLAALGVTPEVVDLANVPSADLTFADVLEVVAAASRMIESGAVGVVVSQGTDTLEETSYLMDLMWPHPEPLVVTGAMRNPTMASPDGAANLLAAVIVAASDAARDSGVTVTLNDEVHAARWVRKRHSTSTASFGSPDAGPIGHLVEGKVRFHAQVPSLEPLPRPSSDAVERTHVGLYTVTMDDDGLLLSHGATSHDGLVVAGFGVGHVPGRMAPILGDLAQRMPVVLASRTGAGSVLRATYGAVGAEADLEQRGLLSSGMLGSLKARVLLRLLLSIGLEGSLLAERFESQASR